MRPIENTITDPAMDRLVNPVSFDGYQEAIEELAIYPRVYTEDQVSLVLLRAYARSDRDTPIEEMEKWVAYDLDKMETPFNRLVYPVLGLLGEAGEVANKLKKVCRDNQGEMDMDKSVEIQAETGDVLWYLTRIASELHTPLERIAYANLRKLFSRKARGVLGGSGDTR